MSDEAAKTPRPAMRVYLGVARGIAWFFGLFTALNLIGGWLRPGFDANMWWLRITTQQSWLTDAAFMFIAVTLLSFAIRPVMSPARQKASLLVIAATIGIATSNMMAFAELVRMKQIESGFALPMSLGVMVAMGVIWVAMRRAPTESRSTWRHRSVVGASVLGCVLLFAFGQMYCFGRTDYRRTADAIVVFGCRVYTDGTPSDALIDRMRTACELYRQGWAPQLIVSGGPGDGDIHETEVMRRLAEVFGVPADDIVVDAKGINTQATVDNTAQKGYARLLAVSHFYHLPRIKMAYERHGQYVCTVPARESYTLTAMPYFLAREAAALWMYYLRPLLG
ncbi:YdcF family protein [Planctomycetales bacterium ZRK34]|nr:YdcF family protein [Planctomycetales bacterium ZRK34]